MRTRPPGTLFRLILGLVAAIAATATLATPAQAAAPENGWTCRAQSLTVTALGESPLQELTNILAAGGEFQPCANTSNSPVGSALKPLTDALALLGVKVGVVQTDTAADTTKPTRDQLPTAHAKVGDVDVNLAGFEVVHVDAAESRVSAKCVSNAVALETSFDVGAIRVFGQAIDLDGPVTEISRGIAGLDIVVRITPGSETDDATFGRTKRALRIQVLQNLPIPGLPAVSLLDLGLGVSNVTVKGEPCKAAAPPTVGVPTNDGRTLTSIVDPPAGGTIQTCTFAVTASPAGGAAAKTVPGLYDPATKKCTAVLTPADFPAGSYTATATASTTDGGAATSAPSPPFALTAPTAAAPKVLTPAIDGRTVAATVTPADGTTIASCRFVITPAGGTPVAVAGTFADNRCTAPLPRASFPPGEYTIGASATGSNGEVGESTGTGRIAGPTVGTPIAIGPLVGAPVTPGPGATITTCTLTLTPAGGGAPQVVQGTYDAPTGGCAAIVPADRVPSGDYDVVVSATDSNGDTAVAGGRVTVGQFNFGNLPAPGPGTGTGTGTTGPATTSDVAQALLACEGGKVTLTDVTLSGSRVRLAGVAQKALAGREVLIRFAATGRRTSTVARVKVGTDGTFSTSVSAPAARLRTAKGKARYSATVSGSSSSALRVSRRMTFTSSRVSGGRIQVSGQVAAPRAKSGTTVTVTRRLTCSKYQTVVRTKVNSRGRFSASFKAPADGSAGLYRASTKVPSKTGGPARNSTFTVPRIVAGK